MHTHERTSRSNRCSMCWMSGLYWWVWCRAAHPRRGQEGHHDVSTAEAHTKGRFAPMGLHIPQVRWLSVPRLPVYAARLACLLHAVRFAAMNPLTEALLLAVAPRDIRACPALLDAGASVNARDSNSPTPLHAAISGHQDVCELLLDRKASINARDITNGADPNAFNVPILHIAALTEGSSEIGRAHV